MVYLSIYLQDWEGSYSARPPQFLNLTTSKAKQVCETSSIFELDNVKNGAILRDFLQTWKIECKADGLLPMRIVIFPLHLSKVLRLQRKNDARSYEVLYLSRKIIAAHLKIWCSKMQPLSGNQRPDLLTSPMNMPLVLRLPRNMHLCRSSSQMSHACHCFWQCSKTFTVCSLSTRSTIPCACHAKAHLNVQKRSAPPTFFAFDFETCFAPQWRALCRRLNFQKWSGPGVLCAFWLRNALRARTACTFSTSQLLQALRTWGALWILELMAHLSIATDLPRLPRPWRSQALPLSTQSPQAAPVGPGSPTPEKLRQNRGFHRQFTKNREDFTDKAKYICWLVDLPLWKMMEFVSWDDDIPNIWENKSHVPNHQPVWDVAMRSGFPLKRYELNQVKLRFKTTMEHVRRCWIWFTQTVVFWTKDYGTSNLKHQHE